MNNTYPGLYVSKGLLDGVETKTPQYPIGWNRTVFQPQTGLGLLYRSPFESVVRETFTYDGKEIEFVDYWPTKKDGSPFNFIRGAYTEELGAGSYAFHLPFIHISQIDLKELKDMELWTILSDEDKVKLETNAFVAPKIEVKEEVVIKSPGRKSNPEYADLPRELICTTPNCGEKSGYISPTILVKKAEEKGVTPQEYIAQYKCPECEPRHRGKRSSPELDHLPREIKCSNAGCDGKLPYISPTMLVQKATDKGITIEEYIASYKCSKCEPKHRGRAPSAKWMGLPRELTCTCGKVVSQHPSMTDKLAKEAGKTFEEYVKDYRCRKCRPETTRTTTTRGRKMSPDSPWFGKAKEVKCACGKVQKQHASITDAQAKKAGKSFDDYVATWKCMDCRPQGEKRARFGRVAKTDTTTTPTTPTNVPNIPKKTMCIGCGKDVTLVPKNIIEKAAILGITVDELVLKYKCRSCGGRLLKSQKQKMELTN